MPWLHRGPSARSIADEELTTKVRTSFIASTRTYGTRRVWRDVLADGASCGLHKIERLMRTNALRARPRRRGLPKDEGERSNLSVAPNALDRQFSVDQPNRKWPNGACACRLTDRRLHIRLDGGGLALRHGRHRPVLAKGRWLVDESEMTAQLVTDALLMAIWRRGKPDALLHHSDRGSQYSSDQFQRLMADNGFVCSMSRPGNVWDNAAMESFFLSLKTERIGKKVYRTRDDARADVFDYIERFYSPPSSLDDRLRQPD